jgi:AbrB family looped-hinge helix DNA binding protein
MRGEVMALTAKITSKGQVTIPKKVRDFLKTDTVEFAIGDKSVILKPVESVGGALARYAAKKAAPLKKVREGVWKEVAYDKATGKSSSRRH